MSRRYWISDMLIKIIALSLTATLLAVILKKYNKELLPFLEITVVILAVALIRESLSSQQGTLKNIFNAYSSGDELFSCLFKGAAITVLTKLASQVCRESGNSLMGEVVELGGRVMLIVIAIPFISEVAQTALSFVK